MASTCCVSANIAAEPNVCSVVLRESDRIFVCHVAQKVGACTSRFSKKSPMRRVCLTTHLDLCVVLL